MSTRSDLDAVEQFYFRYAAIIDDGRLDDWPGLFTDAAVYRIVSKENFDRGLPLCLMYCDGMGMLKDRAFASAKLNVYAPRTWRHLISNVMVEQREDGIAGRANFMVLETVTGKSTQILASGRYVDVLVEDESGIRLSERTVIYDSAVVPGSVVFPL